jgi:hypothetical protein
MLKRSLALGLAMLAVGCGGWQSYPLPVSAGEAHHTFAPLGACASQAGLKFVTFPEAVNVRYEGTWVQFMIQNGAYNMVIIVSTDVPEPDRPARLVAAKAKGDELFACAMRTPRPPR